MLCYCAHVTVPIVVSLIYCKVNDSLCACCGDMIQFSVDIIQLIIVFTEQI